MKSLPFIVKGLQDILVIAIIVVHIATIHEWCFQCNDLEDNISLEARELRDYTDYAYVTLACDDEQIDAHGCCELFLFPFDIEFQVFDIVSILCFFMRAFQVCRGIYFRFSGRFISGGEGIVTTPTLVTGGSSSL